VSETPADVVRRAYDAWNQGDRRTVLAFADPDIEWQTPREDPDWDTYYGTDQLIRFWDQWAEAFGQLRFEAREIVGDGDLVFAEVIRRGTGEESGIEVEDRLFHVIEFGASGRATRVREFFDRDEALVAAGLTG
jgi:ketosteroid isomerase-like protein